MRRTTRPSASRALRCSPTRHSTPPVPSFPYPRQAATVVVGAAGWEIALAEENVAGYRRMTYGPYESEDHAKRVADAVNARLGVSPKLATLIVLSSMAPLSKAAHASRVASWPSVEALS